MTKFTTIKNATVIIREAYADIDEQAEYLRGDLIVVRKDTGKTVATISRYDIFDAEGNRFEFE